MYRTSDFNFVAFVLAYMKSTVDIVEMAPYPSPSARHSGKGIHYEFCLSGANGSDVSVELKKLALDYANGKTVIEPTLFLAKRDTLRGLILDQDKRNRRHTNRSQLNRDRGESHGR